MEYKSYWGFGDQEHTVLQKTDNIFEIMDYQCKELSKYTEGNVFGIFDEIKRDGSLIKTANVIATVLRSVSGLPETTESVGEMSTKDLIDADEMYWKKRFAFEICTEKYRFRVFSMLITPIYPVEITINNGVYKNVASRIDKIAKSSTLDNTYVIETESALCDVLQEILGDRKVLYIVNELMMQVKVELEAKENLPSKVIICEGRTDEIILNAIAQKMKQRVTIVTSNGGYNVPAVFSSVKEKNDQTEILIVVDADGDESRVKTLIESSIGQAQYELAIINNRIEDWFDSKLTGFSKLKLMQTINSILDETDFSELSKRHVSFAKVISFLQR